MKTWIIIITIALILIGLHFWNLRNQRKKYNGFTKKELIKALADEYVKSWNEAKTLELQSNGEITKYMNEKGVSESEATMYLLKFYSDNQAKEITIDWMPYALFDLGLDAKEQPKLLELYPLVKRKIKF